MVKGFTYERAEPDETAGWWVPGEKIEHFESFSGQMKLEDGMDEFFTTKSQVFCKALRSMVTAQVKKKEVDKPELSAEHGLASREYNFLLCTATGMVESANTLLLDQKETICSNIESLTKKIAGYRQEKDASMVRRLMLRDRINTHYREVKGASGKEPLVVKGKKPKKRLSFLTNNLGRFPLPSHCAPPADTLSTVTK